MGRSHVFITCYDGCMTNIPLPEWFTSFDWQLILETYGNLSPLVPILVVSFESFLPMLPLTAIVAWNVAAYGFYLGAMYSWIGTCIGCTIAFFFWRMILGRRMEKFALNHEKAAKGRRLVKRTKPRTLFLILMLPFTASSFMNFAFGVSDYSAERYLITLYAAKVAMILMLSMVGQSIVLSLDEPLFIITAVALIIILVYISKRVFNVQDDEEE